MHSRRLASVSNMAFHCFHGSFTTRNLLADLATRGYDGRIGGQRRPALHFSFHDIRINVNTPTRAALKAELLRRFAAREGFALATVNLDHLVKMRASATYTRAYAAQDIVVADGWPIVTLSQLARQRVELMPGSDMLLHICQWAADVGVRVALFGSTEETLTAARAALIAQIPGLDIPITHAPPMGFDPAGEQAEEILKQLESAEISLCLLAFGAPKQEELAARGRVLAPSVGFASIGAGLDFLSGRQQRAPLLMRRLRLEWLWRALSSPARLIPRYARCAAILPGQAVRALRLRGQSLVFK